MLPSSVKKFCLHVLGAQHEMCSNIVPATQPRFWLRRVLWFRRVLWSQQPRLWLRRVLWFTSTVLEYLHAHLEQLDVEAQATLRGHLRRPAFGTIRVLPRHIYKTAGARAHALAVAESLSKLEEVKAEEQVWKHQAPTRSARAAIHN